MATGWTRLALRRAPRPEIGNPSCKGQGGGRGRGRRRTLNFCHNNLALFIYDSFSSLAIDASPEDSDLPFPFTLPRSPQICFRRLFASLCRCSVQSLGLSSSSLSNSASVFYLFLTILPLCFFRIALLHQRCSPVSYSVVLSTGARAIRRRWECSYLCALTIPNNGN